MAKPYSPQARCETFYHLSTPAAGVDRLEDKSLKIIVFNTIIEIWAAFMV
jgi:hypothetical protein